MIYEKPATLRTNAVKEWIKLRLFTPYLHKIPKSENTLDLACGFGFSFKINSNFYGIECDKECYESLMKKGYKVAYGSILNSLPFEENFFDNVFSHDVLEHFSLENAETIFKNVYKILKPGGKFINIIPNKRGYDFGLKINAGHIHYIKPNEIQEIAQRQNFQYIGSHATPLPKLLNHLFVHNKFVTVCVK